MPRLDVPSWRTHMTADEADLASIVNVRHASADIQVSDLVVSPTRADGRLYVQSIVVRPIPAGGDDMLVWSADAQADLVYFPTSGVGLPKSFYGQALFVTEPGRAINFSIERPPGCLSFFVQFGYYEAW